DAGLRSLVRAKRVRPALLVLYPLIGLLPGTWKRRLADRYGVSDEAASVQSLYLELALVLMAMAFLSIRAFTGAYGVGFGVDPAAVGSVGFGANGVVLLLVAPDLLMRYTRILGESTYPWGFWEWLWRWKE
ncbi:MAG: hypothetical protein R3190_11100, partial [Thermoanaerobaculia bacterium]|nr:hypothetical protein [Thermoanaerobaculia bacterium]